MSVMEAEARTSTASRPRRLLVALANLARPVAHGIASVMRPIFRVVTPAGLLVILSGGLTLTLGLAYGWVELVFLGSVLLAAAVLAALFLIGRSSYDVTIELNPHRVVVGERAMGRLHVRNSSEKSLPPNRMELPVGTALAEFQLPALAPRGDHDELFAVPTHRRAVIVAGPAESVRGDALGLLRRAVTWADPQDLFVHPRTVRLTPSAAGLVRDLEGQVSKKITSSDIAFHALRPYVPGDDRRYVHWRTSARIGQLMVRQFEETRRSQLTMIHVSQRDKYASADEFELAVSVTASIAAQVIRDGTQMNVVSEAGTWRTHTVTSMLDSSSRLEPTNGMFDTVREFARERTKRLPAPSVVMTIGGSRMETSEYRNIETLFGPDTTHVAVHIEHGSDPRISAVAGLTVITVGRLEDLTRLLRSVT